MAATTEERRELETEMELELEWKLEIGIEEASS